MGLTEEKYGCHSIFCNFCGAEIVDGDEAYSIANGRNLSSVFDGFIENLEPQFTEIMCTACRGKVDKLLALISKANRKRLEQLVRDCLF